MKIEHIAVLVNDLETMKAFYSNYFDGRPNEKYNNAAKGFESYFLTFSSGCRLELMRRTDITTGQDFLRIGWAHIAFSLGSREAVDRLSERLALDGYTRLDGPRRTGDGYYESVFCDPENNRIELTV
ncbi:VOC family protein [Exiguobacterium flavidum]|uniref:VOC family protein n=1 Tax=Exiguobacterium flavidum TaxID=2184695 RepID=UPI000DF7D175|nr:VOC family protein [Exiguobacterium flavidum]